MVSGDSGSSLPPEVIPIMATDQSKKVEASPGKADDMIKGNADDKDADSAEKINNSDRDRAESKGDTRSDAKGARSGRSSEDSADTRTSDRASTEAKFDRGERTGEKGNPATGEKEALAPGEKGALPRGEEMEHAPSARVVSQQGNLYKRTPCKLFAKGKCKRGKACTFKHGFYDEEWRSESDVIKKYADDLIEAVWLQGRFRDDSPAELHMPLLKSQAYALVK